MAGLRKRGKTWVARVRPTINGKRKEIPINLRTGSKVTAGQRLAEIKKKEDEIKQHQKKFLQNSLISLSFAKLLGLPVYLQK